MRSPSARAGHLSVLGSDRPDDVIIYNHREGVTEQRNHGWIKGNKGIWAASLRGSRDIARYLIWGMLRFASVLRGTARQISS